MGTSVGAVTDYLIALAESTFASTLKNGQPVLVVDGFPVTKAEASIVIGLDSPPDTATAGTDGSRAWMELGNKQTEEDYVVPFYIDVWQGGTDQKAVRDFAVGMFDAYWSALFADLSLGGLLQPWPAALEVVRHVPTLSSAGATQGRRLLILSGVRCRNRYIN